MDYDTEVRSEILQSITRITIADIERTKDTKNVYNSTWYRFKTGKTTGNKGQTNISLGVRGKGRLLEGQKSLYLDLSGAFTGDYKNPTELDT